MGLKNSKFWCRGLPLLLVLLVFLPTISAFTPFWNNNFYYRYEINITETAGINRVIDSFAGVETIKVKLQNITCANSNYSDLRLIYNNTLEIPYFVYDDYLYFSANITANYTGYWGYIYCFNTSNITETNYTGITLTSAGEQITNLAIPYKNTLFSFRNGTIRHAVSNNAFGMTYKDETWSLALYTPFWDGLLKNNWGWCDFRGNGAVVLVNCTTYTSNFTSNYIFWNNALNYKEYFTPLNFDLSKNIALQIRTYYPNHQSPKYVKYYNLTNGTATSTSTTNYYADLGKGMITTLDYLTDLGLGIIFNLSYINPSNSRTTWGVVHTDKSAPTGVLFGDVYASPNNYYSNLSRFGENANIFVGFYNSTDTAMQESYNSKMYPVIITFGQEQKNCVINFECVDYGNCLATNLQYCEEALDTGCDTTYLGNLTEFTRVCAYQPTSADLTTIDLSQQQNVIMFGLFVFFWLGLGALAFTFKNVLYGSMMFFVGIVLGFWSFSISWILTAMFILFSALFMMRTAKFK